MIENLFTNPKLLQNVKIIAFCNSVAVRANRYALKTGFSLYKIKGGNATF